MNIRYCFFTLMSCIILAGCAQEQKKVATLDVSPKVAAIMDPFKFHKMIEVSPGQYYDILSWGRGALDTGAFMILHSDSTGRRYTTTTGDLNGQIVDVYNADMDVDGHPEILIQAKRKDTINFTTIYAFEFYEKQVQKLEFPKLTSSQRKGYRGNDNFYISGGKFIREFPIYEGTGATAKLTGAKRKLEYSLNSNSFNVKQISKDSTFVRDKVVVTPAIKQMAEEKPAKTKKAAKKKHHKAEVHRKKKKKRHHRSEE